MAFVKKAIHFESSSLETCVSYVLGHIQYQWDLPILAVVRMSAPRLGGTWINPVLRYMNVIKNGTNCSTLSWHSDFRGRARTGHLSVSIM